MSRVVGKNEHLLWVKIVQVSAIPRGVKWALDHFTFSCVPLSDSRLKKLISYIKESLLLNAGEVCHPIDLLPYRKSLPACERPNGRR